jgi:hypothetical protein
MRFWWLMLPTLRKSRAQRMFGGRARLLSLRSACIFRLRQSTHSQQSAHKCPLAGPPSFDGHGYSARTLAVVNRKSPAGDGDRCGLGAGEVPSAAELQGRWPAYTSGRVLGYSSLCRQRRLVRPGSGTAGCPSGQRERSVKPSAKPSLVRTQHLPPPAETARALHICGVTGRFSLVPYCLAMHRLAALGADAADGARTGGTCNRSLCRR